MLLEIYNPNPVPLKDLLENFVNNLGYISGSIPDPVSSTLTTTTFSSSFSGPSFFSIFLAIPTDTRPSRVNLRALSNRLEITCVILSVSAWTKISSL
jgi:hypothetical protein